MAVTDILFVNGAHAEFPYIPMGVFGLCDHLERHGFRGRILNLAVYEAGEGRRLLAQLVEQLAPRYVGLVLHWKELLSSAIQTGSMLRRRFPHIPIVLGGLTATSFAAELMSKLSFVDCVVRGDAELPLLRLLEGSPYERIDNLAYRNDGSVELGRMGFVADRELLDRISFARLEFLHDYPKYLARLEEYLGFPVCVGRGCIFDCEYCGGSRTAFAANTGRTAMAVRSTESIVRDVVALNTKYGCRHILLSHLAPVLKVILRGLLEAGVAGQVVLDIEAWNDMDQELLSLHEELSRGMASRPSLLLSPKTGREAGMASTQQPDAGCPDLREFVRGVNHCHVNVFKGYFRSCHNSLPDLFAEMREMHDMRRSWSGHDVTVRMLAFSTDPASRIASSSGSTLSLAAVHHAILFDRNLSTNILLFRPRSISSDDQQVFERTLAFSEFLFRRAPLVYWLLTEELGFDGYLSAAREASRYYFYQLEGAWYEISSSNLILALNALKAALATPSGGDRPLVVESIDFCLKREVARRLHRLEKADRECAPDYLTLNDDRVLLSRYDFTAALGKIDRGCCACVTDVLCEPSLYLFPDEEVLRLPGDELDMLRLFDGLHESTAIAARLANLRSASVDWVEARIRTLYREGILVSG